MGNGGIKVIVLVALIVVLSFFIGSMSVDGIKSTAVPIALVAGVFITLYLGKNSKFLIYYLPPFLALIPIGIDSGVFSAAISIAVLLYWCVMRLMGYVHFEWIGHWGTDTAALMLFLYGMITFYRHPVSVAALGLETDFMGGKDYIGCFLGGLAYFALSVIPFTGKQLYELMRYKTLLGLGISVMQIGISSANQGDTSMLEAAQQTRFSRFTGAGMLIFLLTYASYPLKKIFCSPSKLILILICLLAVFLGGWRSTLVYFACTVFFAALLKRELTFILTLGALFYAGLLFLSSEKALDELPYGIQRSLCAIPGVHVSKSIEKETTGSSDWRKEMWEWALDPRTGYIKDYVWGDGPGQSIAATRRHQTALMRGSVSYGNNVDFARDGIWHSGWITFMHRFGIVGLSLAVYCQLWMMFFTLVTCFRYRTSAYYPFFIVQAAYFVPGPIIYHLSAGLPFQVFLSLPTLALFKQLYVHSREFGLDTPLFKREAYVPMMIKDPALKNVSREELARG